MKIRFYNAKILTLADDGAVIDGELWTDGDRISYIGSVGPSYEKFDREIDVRGNLLMPGFKNAHTHSAMTFGRSLADDMPLQEWLFDRIFPLEDKLDYECVYTFSKLAFLEYLTSGITSCFDMYMFPEAVADASRDFGFRTVMCGAVSGEKSNVSVLEERYKKFNEFDPLVSYQLGFHAEYTCEAALLESVGELSRKLRAPVFAHNSETEKEVADCLNKNGKTPTALFDSFGMFEYGGGGFHCVHMSDEDIDIFAKRGLYAVTNPGSNCKLASGIAPVCKMMDKGVKFAIGTDGAASNNCLDMFREMFLVTALQKISEKDASACDALDVLKMAAVNGADAMGLGSCNCLKIGKKADIIMLNLYAPNMQPVNNIAKNIVYSASKLNVLMTMINGKILYENGRFPNEDPLAIYEKANYLKEKLTAL